MNIRIEANQQGYKLCLRALEKDTLIKESISTEEQYMNTIYNFISAIKEKYNINTVKLIKQKDLIIIMKNQEGDKK